MWFIIICTLVEMVEYFSGYSDYMLIPLLALFGYMMIYSVRDLTKNIVLLLFLVAFFTFLMGRLILPVIISQSVYNTLFFSWISFTDETYKHVYLSLYLALLFIFVGYKYEQDKQSFVLEPKFNPESMYIGCIRKLSKKVAYFSAPFSILIILEKALFVLSHGYEQIFIGYETSLPVVVLILSTLFDKSCFLFLATLPDKMESKIIISLYTIISISNLLAGDRGEAMMAVFVIVGYLFIRNRLYSNNEKWISKFGVISLFAAAPVVVSLLLAISYLRTDSEFNFDGLGVAVSAFFFQQGSSVNVIACSYQDAYMLPQGKIYSLGAVIDYFGNNYVSRFVTGSAPLKVGSVELATEGNSLDAAITYLESPDFYFNGGGMGSSFIAEAWHDFGYIGIILFSIFYGVVLGKIPKLCARNVWIAVIALIFLKYIMYAPRARATGFVVATLSVSFWPVAYLIYIKARKLKR